MFIEISDIYREVKGCEEILYRLSSSDDVSDPEMLEVLSNTLSHSCKCLQAMDEKITEKSINLTVTID